MTRQATATEMRHATRLGDPSAIIEVLERVGHDPHDPELEGIVKDLLWTTDAPALRNAAAVALADMHSEAAPAMLIKLLGDPSTKGARGTLLYALEELDVPVGLDLIVDLLIHDDREVQVEGLRAIEDGRIASVNSAAIRRAAARLRKSIAHQSDDDRMSVLRKAVHHLEALAG
jgi:HEAT repeat protein